jgi:two-component system, LuxR family, response regulator FixJ
VGKLPSLKSRAVIAVVDDDEAVRVSLKFMLEIDGFVARTYSTPDAFLESGDLNSYSCVVVDQAMPEMTGLSLLSEMRRRGCHSPAILIASNPTAIVRDLAAEAGVPVIEKPLFGNALSEMLHGVIGQT